MPIYEPDLSHDDMVKATDRFVCAVCGGVLTVAWSAKKNCYMLRCGNVLEHKGIKPIGRDQWAIEVNAKLRGGSYKMESTALTKMNLNQMLARIDQVKFPKDLTKVDREVLATVAIDYGLDPAFNELMIYQGRPYVTIDGRRRKAQETNRLDGMDSVPASPEERKTRGCEEGDYLFKCNVWVKGATHPFVGFGKVRAKETRGSEHLPIVNDPAMMAEKRAEARALKRAFHIQLPSAEDIGGEEAGTVEGEFKEIPPAEKPEPKPPPKKRPAPATKAEAPEASKEEELFPKDNPSQMTLQELEDYAKEQGWTASDIGPLCNKEWGWNINIWKDLNTPERINTLAKYISENPKNK